MAKIVFASTNKGKIQELQVICSQYDLEIIPQSDLGVSEIPETGLSFVENAIIKARHAAQATGLPAIADDSGLDVRVLHGEPGIYSARYAGEKASSEGNIQKLLQKLHSVDDKDRDACFHCLLVYMSYPEDPIPIICHGIWKGFILKSPQGTQGFGYDPIFFDPVKNCSAAEMPLEVKNRISHRGKALHLLADQMRDKFHI